MAKRARVKIVRQSDQREFFTSDLFDLVGRSIESGGDEDYFLEQPDGSFTKLPDYEAASRHFGGTGNFAEDWTQTEDDAGG